MDIEILRRIRSEWKAFTLIKDVLEVNFYKTLHANVFNSTVLLAMLYASEIWATVMKEEQKADYGAIAHGKIHARNVVAGAHLKHDNFGAE